MTPERGRTRIMGHLLHRCSSTVRSEVQSSDCLAAGPQGRPAGPCSDATHRDRTTGRAERVRDGDARGRADAGPDAHRTRRAPARTGRSLRIGQGLDRADGIAAGKAHATPADFPPPAEEAPEEPVAEEVAEAPEYEQVAPAETVEVEAQPASKGAE